MIKELIIDNKVVKFKASASTSVYYREMFNADMLKQLSHLYTAYSSAGVMDSDSLETFAKIAYTMAKQADPTISLGFTEWLDEFAVFPIDVIFPELMELWQSSLTTLDEAKKK